jgi:DNA mismatch endonuclease, patch repair protein
VTDVFTPEERSAVMRRVKSKNTAPELALRRLVHARGGRFRLHRTDLPGKPDLVLPRRRIAVFLHGCFWHGHDCPRGGRVPQANREYWLGKVARNRARDAEHLRQLTDQGWRAEVVWECELKDPAALQARVDEWIGRP